MNSDLPQQSEKDEPIFYYDRSRRLQNAPQEVRDLHSGALTSTKGIFRVLITGKRNRYLFASIVILCAVILANNFLGGFSHGKKIGEAYFSCDYFIYEGSCYASASLKPLKLKHCVLGNVTVSFIVLGSNGQSLTTTQLRAQCLPEGMVAKQKLYLSPDAKYLTIAVDYNGDTGSITNELSLQQ